MSTIAEVHRRLHFKLKQEAAAMKTHKQVLDEINSLHVWCGPALAPGVPGFLHKPELQYRYQANNSSWGMRPCIACMCGGCHPQKQTLEEELNEVVLHIAERKLAAERQTEQMREDWYDHSAGTR